LRIILAAIIAAALAACVGDPPPVPDAPPIVLTGAITRADHQTYREIPFIVPPGTTRIAVDFSYDKTNRTVIDLGLRDPQGQRGWSGGNKSRFEITEGSATPSYRPGPLPAGEWKLILGIPNIREGQTATYTATVTLSSAPVPAAAQPDDGRARWSTGLVLAAKAGWYRGDFHAHTAHSDGSCGPEGARLPCPTVHTAEAARDAGLDFVAITDHNTITQLADIRALQADFRETLLIPGTEITTFNGHANVIGNASFVEFQLGTPRLPTLADLKTEVEAAGGILSVNHPSLPSGEICMGCGWTVKDADWSRVSAIEVINGSTLRTSGAEAPMSGIALWDKLLREGHRLTAIGGSDNHDATDRTGERQSPIGKPTTVVHAHELSVQGIVAAVANGRVFIDVAGVPNATLDIAAVNVWPNVVMGGEIRTVAGRNITLDVRTTHLPDGARVEPVFHGVDVTPRVSYNPDWYTYFVSLQAGQDFGSFRANVRDADGKLLLLGNPIYFRRVPAG